MAEKVVSMKIWSAVIAKADGLDVNVAAACATAGVSRTLFYKLLTRYEADGTAGLERRSRRPHTSPNQTSARVEDVVVELRKELADAGLDHGATTIQWHLGRRDDLVGEVPSVATIHRILERRGQIIGQPHKRPKSSWKRFEAPAPNEWWQIDSMDWTIATGVVKVFNIIDDHSRVATRSRAVNEATSVEAWTTFCEAAQAFSLPAGCLSDNGLAFSGKLRGFEVFFETSLRDAGIRPITGRAYHPQTTGKVERFQQTLKKWLRKQRLANNLVELQTQLDAFVHIYNHQRPHQGIGRQIPIDRFRATSASTPADHPLEHPTFPDKIRRTATVNRVGNVRIDGFTINVGRRYAEHDAIIFFDDHDHATVFINNNVARHLTIDRTRKYQPCANPKQPPQLQSDCQRCPAT
jgi:transposase InsO family protein